MKSIYKFLINQWSIPLSRYRKHAIKSVLGLCVLVFCSLQLQAQTVSTFAGNGNLGFVNGTASAAEFNCPIGVAVDGTGNVYVADYSNNCIRKITPAGMVSTFAGNGTSGLVNGTGSAAQFANPTGLAVDGTGNVYVADVGNYCIRKITPAGAVTTLAGNGQFGFVDGPGSAAQFSHPNGVAVDGTGNVYVADLANHCIRKITSAGVVTTLAGNGTAGYVNGTGNAAQFNYPYGVAVDGTGNVYVADYFNHRIRKITSAGVVTTLAGSTSGFADGTGSAAKFFGPYGVAVDGSGNVYVSDLGNSKIRKVTPAGVVTTLAGSNYGYADGTASVAKFQDPAGVALDGSGNVYVTDYTKNNIRKITSCGTAAPTASAQTFCASASPTVANLVATGTAIQWYSVATGGTSLTPTTALATGTYYASQTLNGCEGARTSVSVTVNPTPAAPTASAQTFCASASPTVANLVATGTAIQWYNVATGGTSLTPTTALATGTYYASQTLNGCEGARTSVSVTVNPITAAPTASAQTFCASASPKILNLVATGTATQWYNVATGGTSLTPSTALATGTYYASQTLNGCESGRTSVSVTVNPITAAPTASAQTFCASVSPKILNLVATGTAIQWYNVATGGTSLTPSTALATGTYYATQTLNGCEGARTSVSVTVNPITAAPTASAQTFCASASPTVANLVATGTAIQWYNVATGGTSLTPSTALATGTYYATQTLNGCESGRTSVSVTVNPITAVPTASTQTFCASASPKILNLVATGTAIQWYNVATGGTSLTPTTALATGTYYASQTLNGCESGKTSVSVTVVSTPIFTTTTASAGIVGSSYNLNAGVTGNSQTVVYSVVPTLPTGLSLNTSTGIISGTPILAKTSTTYTVTATQGNCTTSQNYTFAVNCPTMTLVPASLPNRDYNQNYSQSVSVTGNTTALSYSISAGALPTGFTMSSTGVISGTSTDIPTANFTVLAIDANGCSVSKAYSIGLNQMPITVTAIPHTKVYGTADPVLTYSVSPALLPGDNFTGNLVRVTGENVGTYAIAQGNLSAGAKYLITYAGADFTITKASQAITWNQNLVIGCDGETSYTLNASSSSNLPITYTSANTAIATISGNILNFVSPGTVDITSSQAGNNNYFPAINVVNTVVISQPGLIRKHWRDVIFFDNSSNSFSNYLWYKNGALVTGATNQYFKENGDLYGTYHATALRNGQLITTCPVLMNTITPVFDIKVYPNPVSPGGIIETETTIAASNLTGAKIQIYTNTGTIISETNVTGAKTNVTAPNTTGMYIMRLKLINGNVYSVNVLVK